MAFSMRVRRRVWVALIFWKRPLFSKRPAEEARWAGRMRRHSMTETVKTAMTTEGRTSKNWPVSPGTKSRGMKARTLVETAKKTGMTMSFAPLMAAEMRDSPFGDSVENFLADDDRVIDDDAEGDDESEEGDHVDRRAADGEQGDGAEDGNGDADGRPEGDAEIEEQTEGEQDEDETHRAVLHEEGDALAELDGAVAREGEGNGIRECFLAGFDESRTAPATSSGAWLSALKTEMVTERLP